MTTPATHHSCNRLTFAILGVLLFLPLRSAVAGNCRDESGSLSGRFEPSSGAESHCSTASHPAQPTTPNDTPPISWQHGQTMLLWGRLALLVMVLMIALEWKGRR